jgi:hypothetical protein
VLGRRKGVTLVNKATLVELSELLQTELADEDEESMGYCPFHEDSTPSFSINVGKDLYHCFGCEVRGKVSNLLKDVAKHQVWVELKKKAVVWNRRLLNSPDLLSHLEEKKGITPDTIERFMIGWDGERYTIPTPKNVRRYLPESKPKYINTRGFGGAELWPVEQVTMSTGDIFICEGEIDALNAIQHGYAAVTSTSGAGSWDPSWSVHFRDRDVWVCLDSDEAGQRGAKKIQEILSHVAKSVHMVELPVKDVTDFFMANPKGDLREFATSKDGESPDADIRDVPLSEAFHLEPGVVGRSRVRTAGKAVEPYIIPLEVSVDCNMAGTKPACQFCPGSTYMRISPQDVLGLIDVTDARKRSYLTERSGLKCQSAVVTELQTTNVEEVYLVPDVDFSRFGLDYQMHHALAMGPRLLTNETYEVVFQNAVHPMDQHLCHIITDARPINRWWEEQGIILEPHGLSIFQGPPQEKFEEIAHELSKVTGIVGRSDLIIATDLVYHSALAFNLAGKAIPRGWLELLVLGDTRTGKTDTISTMMEYYNLGKLVLGENASIAGLIGGLQQVGKRWVLTWGEFPIHDGALVAVDEMSGLPVESIAMFSGVRSSGIAEITKIHKERTNSRVRIIWISNPRHLTVGAHMYGVTAVPELFGKPEDIARIDMVVTCANSDVPLDVINMARRQQTKSKYYTPELCRQLVAWAWSLKPEQIYFSDDAMNLLYLEATRMGQTYSNLIPLVEGADQRVKLARMAVAAAARTYNVDSNGLLAVEASHVRFVADFLDYLYSKPSFDYSGYSREVGTQANADQMDRVTRTLAKYPQAAQAIADFPFFRLQDVMEASNIDQFEAKEITSVLITARLLTRDSRGYRKTPALINILRGIDMKKRVPRRGGDFNAFELEDC